MARIVKLSENILEHALNFAMQYPFKPYSFYDFDKVRVEKYFHSYILDLYKTNNKLQVLIGTNGEITGLSSWGELRWDSHQLKRKVGRLNLIVGSPGQYEEEYRTREVLLQQILHDINTSHLDYLITRFASADCSLMHLLESYGFINLDWVVTLFMKLSDRPQIALSNVPFNLREARDSDLSSLKKIAYSSYIFDRFHADPIISHELADKLHAAWTENCVMGDVADVVLVAEQDGMILGYIACKINRKAKECLNVGIGNIVLIATSKGHQRQGIAQALVHKSLGWLKNKGVHLLEVTTQIQNVPALWLYQKFGFKIASSSTTMRRAFGY